MTGTTTTGNLARYTYNPACSCSWCTNDGKPPEGYWLEGMYGRVYCVSDSYGNPHRPISRSPWRDESTVE